LQEESQSNIDVNQSIAGLEQSGWIEQDSGMLQKSGGPEKMRVLFISANKEQITMPALPIGLGCVAAATEGAGHEVKLVDLMDATETLSVIRAAMEGFRPDVIGVSIRNIDDQSMADTKFLLDQAKDVVAECRTLTDARIVLGGAGFSMFPESALAYLGAEMGIQGEGEVAFPSLLEALERGSDLSRIPGLYLPASGLQAERVFTRDLDRFPLPEEPLLGSTDVSDADKMIPVQTRRGCAMDCSYCSTATIEGRGLRKRSPEAVVDWMGRRRGDGFKRFLFVDNTFNIPAPYARELCLLLADRGLDITWGCIFYPGVGDKDLIKAMAAAGCTEVSLGFESGSDRMLASLNKRFDTQVVRDLSNMLAEQGISQIGFQLLGGPGETRESVIESFEFVDSLPLDVVKVSIGIRIYPHTALAKTAIEEGVIAPDDDLLQPRFYLAKGLESWLRETAEHWMKERPHWFS
jgi:radical SAM superfamily enzyme YgiQ (UPF0313 family)